MKKLLHALLLINSIAFGQVGIGTITPTGALEINSTLPLPSINKAGLVPPTVALSATNSLFTTNASVKIVNPETNLAPVTGTIVYNTNNSIPGANQVTAGYYFYNGTTWEKFTSGASNTNNWALTGNTGTSFGTNYIGTNDTQPLIIKTDNAERIRVDAIGRVGIGTTADASAILDVSSTTRGFLMPRLTKTQLLALTSAATGLIVYNTSNNKFCVNIGTPATPIWKQLAYEDLSNKQVFVYTGSTQTFTVPAGTTSLSV